MTKPVLSGCVVLLILLSSTAFVPTANAHPNAGLYFDGTYLEFGDSPGYWNGYYDYGYPYRYRYDYPDYRYPPRFIHPPYRYDRYYPNYRDHRRQPYKRHARPRRWRH